MDKWRMILVASLTPLKTHHMILTTVLARLWKRSIWPYSILRAWKRHITHLDGRNGVNERHPTGRQIKLVEINRCLSLKGIRVHYSRLGLSTLERRRRSKITSPSRSSKLPKDVVACTQYLRLDPQYGPRILRQSLQFAINLPPLLKIIQRTPTSPRWWLIHGSSPPCCYNGPIQIPDVTRAFVAELDLHPLPVPIGPRFFPVSPHPHISRSIHIVCYLLDSWSDEVGMCL